MKPTDQKIYETFFEFWEANYPHESGHIKEIALSSWDAAVEGFPLDDCYLRIFNDFYDLLDKVMIEHDDALWANANTTAHEALVLLAAKYGDDVADALQTRLEADTMRGNGGGKG